MSANFGATTLLRTKNDIVRLRYPGDSDPVFVIQLGSMDQNVLVKQGGELVFFLLDLCDGRSELSAVIEQLKTKYDGRDRLWDTELFDTIETLLSWRVLEIVDV